MDTNISIGLGNGRMIFLLGGKNKEPGTKNQEPRTKNQEQRRVSASLKLAVFIQTTDNRQQITDNRKMPSPNIGLHPDSTMNLATDEIFFPLVYMILQV